MKVKFLISTLFITFLSINLFAQFGFLDSTFATNGIYTSGSTALSQFETNDIYGLSNGESYSVTSYYDGTSYSSYVRKLKADGTVDNTFGSNGIYTIPNGSVFNIQLKRIHRTADGKLLVAGNCTSSSDPSSAQRTYVAKVLADGSGLDNAFGTNGATNDTWGNSGSHKTNLTDLNVRFNGKIVLTGDGYDAGINRTCPVIMQLNADGTLDNSFGFIGVYKINTISAHDTYSNCAHEDGSGNFYVAGYSAEANIQGIVFKVNPTGSGLVTTYNSVGYNYPSSGYINDIEVNGSNYYFVGNKVVAGTSILFVIQQNQHGVKRASFASNGVFELSASQSAFGQRIHVRDENEVVVAGNIRNSSLQPNFLLLRLDSAGVLDNTFGMNGSLQVDITPNEDDELNGLFLTSNGTIFTCGEANDKIGITRHSFSVATSISSLAHEQSVEIFPNPFSQSIRLKTSIQDLKTLRLLDLTGKLIYQKELKAHIETIALPNMPRGMYIIQLYNRKQQLLRTQKIQKV